MAEVIAVGHDPHRGHSGQWGLAALWLADLTLVLFYMTLAVLLSLFIGAWQVNAVELRHIEFGLLAGRVIVYGEFGLALLALAFGVLGFSSDVRRRQPFALWSAEQPSPSSV